MAYSLAPDCPAVELIAAEYVAQRFSPHWHAGFAIGVVTRGAQRLRTFGRDWVAGPGDLILLNPGQVHDGSALHAAGWSSRMAYVPEASLAEILSVGGMWGARGLRFVCPVVRSPRLATLFEDWHLRAEAGLRMAGRPNTAEVMAAMASLLCDLKTPSAPLAPDVGLALERCERLRRLGEAVSDALGAIDGYAPRLRSRGSPSTAWRHAQARFGIGPQALQTHLRLVWTKGLLAGGTPIVDAAVQAGYYDQAHFTRQFTAAYGMTPAQFRQGQRWVR